MRLFVYYKLFAHERGELKGLVLSMQRELMQGFSGLQCELMKRPQIDELGRETWMEIYQLSPHDMDSFLSALDRFALQANLPQPRRNELFIACE